jgi:hypothetical protein
VISLEGIVRNMARRKYYNRTNTCYRCGINFEKIKELGDHHRREYNKEGNWTGKWVCNRCYGKYDPNSTNNILKSVANCRTGNLDPNSTAAKGDNFQELTCRWRSTVSTIPVEDLNKKLDNHKTPIDHTIDSELGIIQTKGRSYDSYNRYWITSGLNRDWKKEFDYLIFYCTSEDGNIIDRIYIIPSWEIIEIKGFAIVKNPTIGWNSIPFIPWYEKYRVKDEETIKKVNEIWQKILDEKKNKKMVLR